MKNSLFRTPRFSAFEEYFYRFIESGAYPFFGFGHSTNRLSVPLSAWRVGTPSPFAYAHQLKGGASKHEPKSKTRNTREGSHNGIKRGENPVIQ